jgi:hypothetical protein
MLKIKLDGCWILSNFMVHHSIQFLKPLHINRAGRASHYGLFLVPPENRSPMVMMKKSFSDMI